MAPIAGKTPHEIWQDYFSKRRPKPVALSKLILELHKAAKHDHVVAAIEAAFINGQGQPWMYDVLVGSMKIVGRPQSEINRVLASRIDFTGTDVASMLYTAAHFVRMEAPDMALRLYRQASRIAPTRPEPYVLGLKLAKAKRDYDALQWAATGVLTTLWTKSHKILHSQAEAAAADAIQTLQKTGRTKEADEFQAAMRQARRRDLILKLTWSGPGDLDMLVEEPRGSVCSTSNPLTVGGGVLVHDGFGPKQSRCYEEYVCAQGMPGKYRVRIRHVYGDIVGKRATLHVVRGLGTPYESVKTFGVELSSQDKIIRISLPKGRRSQAAVVPAKNVANYQPRGEPRGGMGRFPGLTPNGRKAGRRFGRSRGFARGGNRVGFRPVISLISEGASLTAMAVVSGDRRYVRLSINPQFTQITDVFTFSFINSGGNPTGNPGAGGNGGGGGGIGNGGNGGLGIGN